MANRMQCKQMPSRSSKGRPSKGKRKIVPSPIGARYLYVKDVMAFAGVSARCVRKWISNGKLTPPDGVLGQRSFWYSTTIDQWDAENRARKNVSKQTNFRKVAAPKALSAAS